ncbi:MAG: hypothetical protein QXT14_08365 [Candidatus Bathyarchaeia archaeon]
MYWKSYVGVSRKVGLLTFNCLNYYWFRGRRNGAIRMLSGIKRGFYNSCRLLAKANGAIRSPKLISMLMRIIAFIRETPRLRALRHGFKRAREILSSRVLNWAPQVLGWIRDRRFILWLGFMEMNNLAYFKFKGVLL